MTSKQLAEMMKLQDQFNQVVNPAWKDADYPFHQAICVEAAEAMEHYGYKWWKRGESNLEQTKMELVDIFHFGLSMMALAPDVRKCPLSGVHQHLRKVIHAASADFPYFDMAEFTKACECVGMSSAELYKLYIMKNVLNKFRQDNGYKTGTYIKNWGEEYPCLLYTSDAADD